MHNTQQTDWAQIDMLTGKAIETAKKPPLAHTLFDDTSVQMPQERVSVTLLIDPDILAWFQAQGVEWQQRMHAALRMYVEAHQEAQAAPSAAQPDMPPQPGQPPQAS
jgi:uncharacterized protein (DUF4415 family)